MAGGRADRLRLDNGDDSDVAHRWSDNDVIVALLVAVAEAVSVSVEAVAVVQVGVKEGGAEERRQEELEGAQ